MNFAIKTRIELRDVPACLGKLDALQEAHYQRDLDRQEVAWLLIKMRSALNVLKEPAVIEERLRNRILWTFFGSPDLLASLRLLLGPNNVEVIRDYAKEAWPVEYEREVSSKGLG